MAQRATAPQEADKAAGHGLGIGLMGLGVVGSGVARILTERAGLYQRRIGLPLRIRRILVRDPSKPHSFAPDPDHLTSDADDLLGDPEIQIIVELIGGEEPAYGYIRRALEGGRSVVTANKEVIAKHGPELLALADERGAELLYEASVGGGIPLIAPFKRDLLANEIISVRAILNGTTNYILTRMSQEGTNFDVALKQAQELGYAEADPTNDVEGIDAAYKLAILSSLAFHTTVHPADVYHEGITRLTANDFRYARELGYVIKLLAICRRDDSQGIAVRVHPALLAADEPLAKVDGVYNAVELEGDLLGLVLFQGRGAGALPTTSAVVADLIDIATRIAQGRPARPAWRNVAPSRICPIQSLESRYYLRMRVSDRAGVLSKVAAVLGDDHGISISDIIQKETHEADQTAEIVIMTHVARESAMQAALAELERLAVVSGVGNFLRVED